MEEVKNLKSYEDMTKEELITELGVIKSEYQNLMEQARTVLTQRNRMAEALENMRLNYLFKVVETGKFDVNAEVKAIMEITESLGLKEEKEEEKKEEKKEE